MSIYRAGYILFMLHNTAHVSGSISKGECPGVRRYIPDGLKPGRFSYFRLSGFVGIVSHDLPVGTASGRPEMAARKFPNSLSLYPDCPQFLPSIAGFLNFNVPMDILITI